MELLWQKFAQIYAGFQYLDELTPLSPPPNLNTPGLVRMLQK